MNIPTGFTELLPSYRADTRTTPPDIFVDETHLDWQRVTWDDLGRPYEVKNYSKNRTQWEAEHEETMPVEIQWQHFNRAFHDLFIMDVPNKRSELMQTLGKSLAGLHPGEALETLTDLLQVAIWNKVHRVDDAVWDPRGKRALFDGLEVEKPEILFLGSAEGYEAMQLLAMYPGGHTVLVDYDDFCRTERFGKFPEAYPFLGCDPSSGQYKTYFREEMNIDFEVADIRDLKYGKEFDIVLSVGLVEHFPDEYKPLVMDMHRQFLKPGGYAILTTPRRQWKSRAFYMLMGEIMNYGYRELMDARQLGLYVYENGFDILRCGTIKAHNGIVAQAR